MVKIECDGCQSPYQIDRRRIPASGLKMRCPKCGNSLLVTQEGLAKQPAAASAQAPPREAPFAARRTPQEAPPARSDTPTGLDADDLPAVFGAATAPTRAFPVQVPRAPARAATMSFGEIDLAAPPAPGPQRHLSAADLPVVRGPEGASPGPFGGGAAPPAPFGAIDLPVAQPRPQPGFKAGAMPGSRDPSPQPRPAYAAPIPDDDEAELPSAAVGLPAARRVPDAGGAHLPVPAAGLPLPRGRVQTRSFGELDLPIVGGGAGLPMASGASLPSPAGAGLPTHSGAGLPTHSGAGFPTHAGAGLPTHSGAGFPTHAGAGLPTHSGAGFPTHAGAGLPTHSGGLPMTAQVGFPAPGGTLPTTAQVGFPTPGGTLPMTAPTGLPIVHGEGRDIRFDATDLGMQAPRGGHSSAVSGSYDEVSLAGPPPEPEATEEDFDGPEIGDEMSLGFSADKARAALGTMAHDTRARQAMSTGGGIAHGSGLDANNTDAPPIPPIESIGGEAEIEEGPDDGGSEEPIGQAAPQPTAPTKAAGPILEIPRRSHAKRYVIAGVVLAALGGGSLSLIPDIGPFGLNAISDSLSASTHDEALARVRASVQKSLGEDTAAAAGRALLQAKSAHEAALRHRPTSAYAAFAAFARGLRFGKRGEDETYGKQMLELVGPEASGDDTVTLAMAAQDAASGQLARARQAAGTLAQRSPKDVDVAVLAGEIELSAKAPDKALVAWKRAVEIDKSARTLYGLARSAVALDDLKVAEQAAKDAIAASPQHAGARTLLAAIAWRDAAREGEALELLTQVTDEKGDVRKSASEPELVEAFTLLGRVHLARSRMSAAELAFGAALKLDPQAVQALVGNGELFYLSGRFSEALARFEAAMRADADHLVAKVGAAKTWLSLERMKEAKDLLKKLREANPSEPLVAYWLGRTEDALGNKKESETSYLDAIKAGGQKPEVIDAYVALAHLLSGLGRVEEATSRLEEASKQFPESPDLHRAKGEVLLQMGRYEEAKTELEAALVKDEDLGTRYKLGVTLRRMRDFDEAAKVFDDVAAVDKEYPGLSLERGLLFEQTGQTDRALEMYNEALRKAPNDVDMMLRVGSTQVMAGHASQAETVLREVLKQRPKSAEANHFLGRALLVKGTSLSEAMRYLEQATAIDPNRAEFFLYVGWGANESGQPQKAQSALERALELDRDLGDAYWQRGILLQKQGATIDALNDLKTALAKRPSRYEAYATMALCYGDQAKWELAEDAWRKAIAADGTVAEWHYRLGKIYAGHTNQGGASKELARALELATAAGVTHKPAWLFDAHFLYAEAMRSANQRDKAIEHYRRFLDLSPSDNAYRSDAEKQLEAYGERVRP